LNRGGALGHVQPVAREEQYTQSKHELVANIKMMLAGFLSERIRYGVTSTGAASDFANALSTAQAMVWQFGMGPSGVIGNYAITQNNQAIHSTMSESFKKQLNEETQFILKECEKETEAFLRKEWDMVELFANALVQKEELNHDEIEEMFAQHGKARVTPLLS
jgi:cell division protease FtsH